MTSPAITLRNLSFSYETTVVLQDVSFSVNRNSFFVIIGPNGSGKSTLLKTLAGLLPSKTHNIDLLGRPLHRYTGKALARTLALVTQNTPVDFPFSVLDVVLMGRAPHLGLLGLPGDEDLDIARRSLAFTGISHLAERKMDRLSGGEQQRVFIARAICQEPEIILLDEPTASLDLAHQVKIMDLMEKLKNETGVTVVMVSHDINLAAMYAESMLLLSQGRIASAGAPEEVITYRNLEEAYGCTLLVDQNPLGKYPRITLVPQKHLNPDLISPSASRKQQP